MESSLIAFALMPGKAQAHYEIFFQKLSQKVMEEFGELGQNKVC
jgi:hypothetical protein